ncbi:hypothetical protein BH18ACT4_BH18ACT4_06110 [soil metagenome]
MTRWDDVGDLRRLVDPESLTALLREGAVAVTSAVPDHLRLKPGVNAIVGVRLEIADGALPGYVRTYADAAHAGQLAAKWQRKRVDDTPLGPGVRLLPGGASVLFLFPHDARVRRLRPLLGRPRRLARLLAELEAFRGRHSDLEAASFETLRYKPERRLVAAAHLSVDDEPRHGVFRLRPDGSDCNLAVTGRLFHQALGARVPRPLGTILGGALVAEEHVRGVALATAVEVGEAEPGALADVVAGLHASGVALPARRDGSQALGSALAALDLLAGVDRSIAPTAARLRADLAADVPSAGPPAPLHGDLHLDQLILGAEGPVVLDFERAVAGPPRLDLGTLVAHLRIGGHDAFAAAFLDAYVRLRPTGLGDLPFFVACGLVEQALLAFRSVRPAWREMVPQLIELAREELIGPAPWQVAYPRRSGRWPTWGEVDGVRRYGRWDPVSRTQIDVEPHSDEALPALGRILDRGGLLVAYRPGQRAVVRVDDGEGCRYVKVTSPGKARRLVTRTVALHQVAADTPDFPLLAPLVDADVEQGTIVFAELVGPTLRDLLLAGEAGDALPDVAAAMAAFHGVAVPAGIEPGGDSGLADWVGFVSAHAVGLAPAYERVLETLPAAPIGERVAIVHGDLHDGNLVIGTSGVGVLDIDGVAAGDPVEDVGNLLAHLVLRALQRGDHGDLGHRTGEEFVAAYQAAGGQSRYEAVAATVARALFRLACVYRFRGRWHALAPELLREASRQADRPWARAGAV